MTVESKSFYTRLAKQIEAEGKKCASNFVDDPQTQEEVSSIFDAMVASLELTDSISLKRPDGELARVRSGIRNVTECIAGLHKLGLQDVQAVQDVKRTLEEKRDDLLSSKPRSHQR